MRRRRKERRSAARPSPTASGRFGNDLHDDIADLRVRFEEASLRSEVHLRTGDTDGAREAVRDQADLLEAFHVRVRHRIADALIERDAEGVLRDAVDELERSGHAVGEFAVAAPAPERARTPVVAAIASLAAVLATMLLPAGTTGVRAPHEVTSPTSSDVPVSAAAPTPGRGVRDGSPADRSVGAADRPGDARDASSTDLSEVTEDAPDDPSASFLQTLLQRLLDAVALPAAGPGALLKDLPLDPAEVAPPIGDGATQGLFDQSDTVVERDEELSGQSSDGEGLEEPTEPGTAESSWGSGDETSGENDPEDDPAEPDASQSGLLSPDLFE